MIPVIVACAKKCLECFILTHLVPRRTCVIGTIIILLLQVWKLGQGEVEKFAQASGRAGWQAVRLGSSPQVHAILPACVSPSLLSQDQTEGSGQARFTSGGHSSLTATGPEEM